MALVTIVLQDTPQGTAVQVYSEPPIPTDQSQVTDAQLAAVIGLVAMGNDEEEPETPEPEAPVDSPA